MSHTILCDVDRCSGCFACIISCFDQNSANLNEQLQPWRSVFQVENASTEVRIKYFSHACMHCQDSPCLMGCPTGAISKDTETGAVRVNPDICIGCYSCSLACPFGVPRFGSKDKMQKCILCFERIKDNLEPACVRVCPTKALQFGKVSEMMEKKQLQAVRKIVAFNI